MPKSEKRSVVYHCQPEKIDPTSAQENKIISYFPKNNPSYPQTKRVIHKVIHNCGQPGLFF